MVSPTNDVFPSHRPAPLAWKEFRRRSGFTTQPKVYVYDASPQIVPQSPPITALSLSPIIGPPSLLGMESPRKEHSGYLVSHVSQALQVLGSSTGGNIAEYIASNFSTELGIPYEKGRKLHYMVNAILSSPKYKYLFQKDQILKDEKRSLWRLKKPGDILDEETQMPAEMSLSSLIPPTSPYLSLKASRDDMLDPLAVPTASAMSTPTLKSSALPRGLESFCGGSNEGEKPSRLSRSAEHAHAVPDSSSLPPLSPCSPCPSSPLGDTPSALSLSARRKKRKNSGLDGSIGSESGSPKSPKQEEQGDEKKRRLDIAAA